MGALSFVQTFLLANLGARGASASSGGPANAKVRALMPYAVGTTGIAITYPSLAAGITVTPPNNTYGTSNWTQLLSSGTLNSHMLIGLNYELNTIFDSVQFELQFASGAAGAEVAVAKLHVFSFNGSVNANDLIPLPIFPPIKWPTNERVSARTGGDSTSANLIVSALFQGTPV